MSLLTITIKENLRLKNVTPELMETLVKKLEFHNPKWLENERMGRWNRGTPRLLKFYDKVGAGGLWIPRGYIRHLIDMCRRQGVKFRILFIFPVAQNVHERLHPTCEETHAVNLFSSTTGIITASIFRPS